MVKDDFLISHGMAKGGMALIDEPRATAIYEAMGPAVEVSGGSAANTVTGGVGLAWKQKFSTWSLDYDAQKAGGYFGHNLTLTYRARF